jgi:hypothetical protein
MKNDTEIQMAFKLWESMAQLEMHLWDRYYNEFLDLIIEKEDKILQHPDANNDFPF